MRDGLISLLTHLITPHLPPPLPSFYPPTPVLLHSSPATKKGKWGGDAHRWMVLVQGGRLLLYRGVGSREPLTCWMLSEVVGVEKKGGKRLRVRGEGREWEVGVEGEGERDDWWRRIMSEREAVLQRGDEWMREVEDRREKEQEDARREAERQAREDAQLEEQRRSHTAPDTPQQSSHSPLLGAGEQPVKRRTVPTSSAFFASAQMAATKAKAGKRASLSVRTRQSPPPMLPQSALPLFLTAPSATTPHSTW